MCPGAARASVRMMSTEPLTTYRESRTTILAALALLGAVSGCASALAPSQKVEAPAQRLSESLPVVAASGTLSHRSIESQYPALASLLMQASSQPSSELLAAVGEGYADLSVRDTALDYFSRSLAINRRHVPALDGSARVWRDSGQYGRALTSSHQAVYFAPHSPAAWNTLGTIMQALSLYREAAQAYRRSVALDPSAVYAMNNLCYLTFLQGDNTAALAECALAVSRDRAFLPATNNLALVQAAEGMSTLAYETFVGANGAAVAHYNMGMVRLAQRRYSDAVAAFEAAYHAESTFDLARVRAREARRLGLRSEKQNVHPSR